MTKDQLIKIGAFAQRIFCLAYGFSIREVDPAREHRAKIAVWEELRLDANSNASVAPTDEVILEPFTIDQGNIHVWLGYSKRANTLVVQAADEDAL